MSKQLINIDTCMTTEIATAHENNLTPSTSRGGGEGCPAAQQWQSRRPSTGVFNGLDEPSHSYPALAHSTVTSQDTFPPGGKDVTPFPQSDEKPLRLTYTSASRSCAVLT